MRDPSKTKAYKSGNTKSIDIERCEIISKPFLQKEYDKLSLRLGKEAKKYNLNDIVDRDIKRKLESISQIGTSILPEEDLERYNVITNEMEKIYSTAKVADYKDRSKKVSLEPEITLLMGKSRDPQELEYYWTEYRSGLPSTFYKL